MMGCLGWVYIYLQTKTTKYGPELVEEQTVDKQQASHDQSQIIHREARPSLPPQGFPTSSFMLTSLSQWRGLKQDRRGSGDGTDEAGRELGVGLELGAGTGATGEGRRRGGGAGGDSGRPGGGARGRGRGVAGLGRAAEVGRVVRRRGAPGGSGRGGGGAGRVGGEGAATTTAAADLADAAARRGRAVVAGLAGAAAVVAASTADRHADTLTVTAWTCLAVAEEAVAYDAGRAEVFGLQRRRELLPWDRLRLAIDQSQRQQEEAEELEVGAHLGLS